MLLTFYYERFTFSLGNSDKWLLFAVSPAPQTWYRKPGIIAGRAGCHGNDSQIGRGGFGWSLRPPRRAAYKTKTRGPFLAGQSTTSQVVSHISQTTFPVSELVSVRRLYQSVGVQSVRRLYQSVGRHQLDGFTSQSKSSQ